MLLIHANYPMYNTAEKYVNACIMLVLEGKAPINRPRKTWQNTLSADKHLHVHDQKKLRAIGRRNELRFRDMDLPKVSTEHDQSL